MSVSIPAGNLPSQGTGGSSIFPTGSKRAFALVTALFFIWGMSNNLTDILVQQFRKSFELSAMQAQLVQTAVFLGYFCTALPAALLMERKGYKGGIIAGLILFGVGTLCFWPAAVIGQYLPFLVALFILGCGSAILETASNPFIAQAGSPAAAARRLNFSQAFNPPGTITGVLLGAYFIFSGVEMTPAQVLERKAQGTYVAYLHGEIMRVVPVYVGLGCLVLFWAFLIWRTPFQNDRAVSTQSSESVRFAQVATSRHLWFAVFAQFFYVGAQISTWSALIPYLKQYTSFTERTAAQILTGCLFCFAAGRISSTVIMRWVRPITLIFVYSVVNVGLLALTIGRPGVVGAVGVLLSSFFMAPMFPTIFATGVEGLGPATKLGGSLIVMSIVGGAVIPPLLGYVARQKGSYAAGYGVTLLCYVIVMAYSLLEGRRSYFLRARAGS